MSPRCELNVALKVENSRDESICLIFDRISLTYGDVRRRAEALRQVLTRKGIAVGDHVALLLPNGPDFVAAYLAVLGLGAVAVCINPILAPDEIEFILRDSDATLMIGDDARTAQASRAGLVLVTPGEGLGGGAVPAREMEADRPAVLVYSSGTAGRPKGILLSHGNIAFTAAAKVRYMGVTEADRLLLFLPLHHCFGQNAIMNPSFFAGAALVLHRRFDRSEVTRSLREDAVTMAFGVPTTFLALEDHLTAADTASVRYWFSAAAPLPLELERRWSARHLRPIHQGYGQTECSPFATYNHAVALRPGTVGTPIDRVDLRIVDPADGRPCAAGQPGEILLRGPNVMLGYWKKPEDTARVLRDGWLHTGDIGRVDEDGYLSVEDRLSDLIIVGGRNVYPAEVENILHGHPSVAQAAVYGVEDPFLGEEVWARVVVKPGHAEAPDELEALCRKALAPYKVPAVVEFAPTLPRTPTGKVLKRELRASASRPAIENAPRTSRDPERWAAAWLARHLGLAVAAIDRDRPFAEYGLDSVMGVALARDLGQYLGQALDLTLVWDASSLAALTLRLDQMGLPAVRRPASAAA